MSKSDQVRGPINRTTLRVLVRHLLQMEIVVMDRRNFLKIYLCNLSVLGAVSGFNKIPTSFMFSFEVFRGPPARFEMGSNQ